MLRCSAACDSLQCPEILTHLNASSHRSYSLWFPQLLKKEQFLQFCFNNCSFRGSLFEDLSITARFRLRCDSRGLMNCSEGLSGIICPQVGRVPRGRRVSSSPSVCGSSSLNVPVHLQRMCFYVQTDVGLAEWPHPVIALQMMVARKPFPLATAEVEHRRKREHIIWGRRNAGSPYKGAGCSQSSAALHSSCYSQLGTFCAGYASWNVS